EGALVGLLAAAVTRAVTPVLWIAVVVGLVIGLVFFAASVWVGSRQYRGVWKTYRPANPSPHGHRADPATAPSPAALGPRLTRAAAPAGPPRSHRPRPRGPRRPASPPGCP